MEVGEGQNSRINFIVKKPVPLPSRASSTPASSISIDLSMNGHRPQDRRMQYAVGDLMLPSSLHPNLWKGWQQATRYIQARPDRLEKLRQLHYNWWEALVLTYQLIPLEDGPKSQKAIGQSKGVTQQAISKNARLGLSFLRPRGKVNETIKVA